MKYIPEIKKIYKEKVINYFIKKLKYKNKMEIPKIEKIVINMTLGKNIKNKKCFNNTYKEIKTITGQKPLIIKAKKSISNFKIRKNENIAFKVTLRRNNMFEFINKLINIALPRIKNFKGFSISSFDYYGNLNFGINDFNIFPEIFLSKKIHKEKGLNINIIIKNKNIKESYKLLKKINFPFV
ncbi:MAG: 50S ribosomal protein L5 [Candidatus Vidania fulgoroideorum]